MLLFPLLLFAIAILVGLAGFLLTLVGLDSARQCADAGVHVPGCSSGSRLAALPLIVPRLVLLGVFVAAGAVAVSLAMHVVRARSSRRARGGLLWRLLGSPLSRRRRGEAFASQLWTLIRGAAPLQQPRDAELARRYVELLADNLGQPGFRELLLVVHDLDARQDLIAAFLAEQHRARFFGRLLGAPSASRAAEVLDLAGVARDHAIDVLAASLALPVATEPHLVTSRPKGRGAARRTGSATVRAALTRVIEEVAAAGAEQVDPARGDAARRRGRTS